MTNTPADVVAFLDMPEDVVLQARAELRKAHLSDHHSQWMKDLAVDAALENIFNIFRASLSGFQIIPPPRDRDLCQCKIGQCRYLTERCREVGEKS